MTGNGVPPRGDRPVHDNPGTVPGGVPLPGLEAGTPRAPLHALHCDGRVYAGQDSGGAEYWRPLLHGGGE